MARSAAVGTLVLVLVFSHSDARAAQPDRAGIAAYLSPGGFLYIPDGELKAWDQRLKSELTTHRDLAKAAETLAPAAGLTVPQMLRLEELWLEADAMSRVGIIPSPEERRNALDALDLAFVGVVRETSHNPLVVDAASALAGIDNRCDPEPFLALLDGAPDKSATGWRALQIHTCGAWQEIYAKTVPENWRSTLVDLGKWNTLPRARKLALSNYLASDALAPNVSPDDLFKLRAHFAAEHFEGLLGAGLVADGIAFWNGLPESIRETLSSESQGTIDVTVDGAHISISAPSRQSDLRLALAAAHVANGDIQTARSVAPWWPLINARLVLSCWTLLSGSSWLGALSSVCVPIIDQDEVRKAALLDLTLNYPDVDAFNYVEVFHGLRGGITDQETVWGLLLCKRLGDTEYKRYCEDDREFRAWNANYAVESHTEPDSNGMIPVFEAASAGRLAPLVNDFQSKLVAVVAQYRDVPTMQPLNLERDAGPLPSPFAERPLPAQFMRPEPQPEGLFESPGLPPEYAPLPAGYLPIRIERDGGRVVIISVSQNLDPAGESTRGGYWVHVSSDGGKSWQAPLYTGLAERFPYVVVNSSAMPLIAGDTLNLEVRIEQIGRAFVLPAPSIPSTRSESGLYLEIPLDVLRADDDSDGISNIVETHLLLDPENPDSDGDGLTDGTDPMPNVKRGPPGNPIQQAMGRIIERISRQPKGAIIGPLEIRKEAPDRLEDHFARALFGEPLSADSPILVVGKVEDFAGFIPSRMMLVYTEEELNRIHRMSSESNPVRLSEVTLNRARTRGFVHWSASGFTGGTFRLFWNGTEWTITEMQRWFI